MAKHERPTDPTTGSSGMAHTGLVLGRGARVGAEQVRTPDGKDIEPGDVLPTGVVLRVDRNDIDGESRLEMVGAMIHYVDHGEPVTVLAQVDRATLDAISVGAYMTGQR